jgi:DNA-binding Lrp family transcriptional regulator
VLDETDRRIIEVLERDARTSLRKIAGEVGVALGTVSNRVRKMEEKGIITGYRVMLDSDRVGWGLKIAKDPRVYGVYDVTGDFDSMVVARARDRRDLDDLSKNLLSMDGVARSVTHLVLNTVKEEPTSFPDE